MASKLFNFLNIVENSRKQLLNVVNEQGADLSDDVSLATIASVVDLKTINRPVPSYKVKYYDDPEDDPAVWKRPIVYTQIDEIWNGAEPYINETTGLKMYPAALYVIDTEHQDIELNARNGSPTIPSTYVNPLEDNVLSFCWPNPNSMIGNATAKLINIYLDVHTNDGAVYNWDRLSLLDAGGTASLMHTFDNSKDIIDINGKHYKYLLVYSSLAEDDVNFLENPVNLESVSSLLYLYMLGTIFTGDGIILPYVIFDPVFVRYGCRLSNICSKINWVKYDGMKNVSDVDLINIPKYHSMNYVRCFAYNSTSNTIDAATTYYPETLYRLEIYRHPQQTIIYYAFCYGSKSNLNTYISNLSYTAFNAKYYRPDVGYSIPDSLVYMKCEYIHPSTLAKYGAISFSSSSAINTPLKHLNSNPLLKYAISTATADDVDERNRTMSHTWESDSSSDYRARRYQYPFLKAEYLIPMLKYVNFILDDIIAEGISDSTIELPSIKSIQMNSSTQGKTYGFHTNEIILPNLKNTTNETSETNQINAKTVYLPNVTELSKTLSGGGIESLLLPALTNITATAVLPSAYHISVPNLQTCNKSTVFNKSALISLELPNLFKFSLDLSACYHLNPNTVLDILDKTCTLAEGETYTLTFDNTYNRHPIIDSKEYKSAIEKGWTVKFN